MAKGRETMAVTKKMAQPLLLGQLAAVVVLLLAEFGSTRSDAVWLPHLSLLALFLFFVCAFGLGAIIFRYRQNPFAARRTNRRPGNFASGLKAQNTGFVLMLVSAVFLGILLYLTFTQFVSL